ncbi:hypothetical protein FAES_1825 [Fibrella aestuarina BUZ 2]|uniref:Uncharacterized protein n=1 Tax=Fibrella aestuarina BUZ 2 TaxID=1166018 RepID=I0K6T2_9BACT|nr:hypothetical protein [Fibrella aestuarina]CCG99835.1 hypothetical protein FAES_1825 [Fibrella aestuarina BUZ 2]
MAKKQDTPELTTRTAIEPIYADFLTSVDHGNGTLIFSTDRADGDTVNVVINGETYVSEPVADGQFWIVTGKPLPQFSVRISN